MATRWEIVLPPQDTRSEESLRAIAEQVALEIQYWDERLSLFHKQSLVSYINVIAQAKPVKLDEREWQLFSTAREIWEKSSGAFDITVAPLMKQHGLHSDCSSASAGDLCGMQHVVLDSDARTISFAQPGIGLDLGAIAKGFALDQVAELLREHGIDSAFVHAGTSSSLAIGTQPDGRPWRVALGTDEHDPVIELVNQSLSVSARRTRPAELATNTNRLHVLDPRTIDQIDQSDLELVAIVHEFGSCAEAWSTACLVNGSCNLPQAISLAAKTLQGKWIVQNLNRAQSVHPVSSESLA